MRRLLAPPGVIFFLREAVDFSLIFRLILCSLVRIVSVLRRWMHSDYFDNALKQPPSGVHVLRRLASYRSHLFA